MQTLAGPPLIETKLRPPDRRAAFVPRPDLVARLEAEVATHRLTVVSAAAGWGKTTLVVDWLAAQDAPTAWVALDDSDNDPARFWRYVSEALGRAGIALDAQAVGALSGADATREVGLTELINAVAGAEERTVLALDDLHAVGEPSIVESLAFLVPRLPDNLRLLVTTRSDPPIGLARLRARGDLGEVRAGDLRFTAAEAARLLGDAIGADLPAHEVERLRARTEGWAAGLYLAGLSLRGRDDAEAFIADFAGDDRLVVDYLAAEVLEGQPRERRTFLLRTAILPRLTAPLCDAVTGRDGSAAVLTELERSNLFLVPLDSRREWYRYHHLFGELLRHELTLEAPGEVAELHRRASRWFESNGDVDEAIHHAAAAGDVERAADLIAVCWAGYERSGWTATTQRWLALLPDDRVRADPRLCLAAALIAINLGRAETAAPWLDAAERAAARPGAPGDPRAVASDIASGRSLVALLSGDTPAAVEIGREALTLGEGVPPWSRAIACLALGIALHSAYEREEAYPHLEEVLEYADAAQAPAVVALSHLAHTDVERGDLALAERRALRAIDIASAERHAEYPHAAGAHAVLGQVRSRRGDHDPAREFADRGVDLARRGRSRPETAHAILARAEVLLAAGDRDGARADADEARTMLEDSVGNDNLHQMLAVLEEQLGGAAAAPVAPPPGGELTDRELAVLRRLTGDGSAREIAADLYVSHNTVKTQMRAIYRKLGVATREDAVAAARERGLLPRPLSG